MPLELCLTQIIDPICFSIMPPYFLFFTKKSLLIMGSFAETFINKQTLRSATSALRLLKIGLTEEEIYINTRKTVLGASCLNPIIMLNETLRVSRAQVALEEVVVHSQILPAGRDLILREYKK